MIEYQTQTAKKISINDIKRLSTDSIKQHLFGKTIKVGSSDYEMLGELIERGIDIKDYEIALNVTEEEFEKWNAIFALKL